MKQIFFLWFLTIASILIAAAPGSTFINYNVQEWETDSGLPGNSVIALRQTADGYLWIGTQDGLVRFDGVHFEVYTRETVPQLKSNEIHALYADRNNVLWIGTATGGLTYYKDGEFFTYPAAENNALSRIRAIAEDRWGNLWIGSSTGGLTCLNNGKFTTYTTKHGLPGNQVRFIYKDENQDLWVAVSAGIVKLQEPGTFQTYAPHDLLPYLKTACLYETGTGNLWIGTGDGGLFKLKNGNAAACSTGADVMPGPINTIYKDRRENLWIGMDGGGLIRLNGGEVLDCGSVYAITEDSEGGLWVGTLDRGLYRLNDNKFAAYTARDGLSHDIAHCIYETRDGVIWVGTEGGLDRIKNGKPSTVLTTGAGLLNNLVSCLFEDTAGNLWIGTWGGLHRYRDGKLTVLTQKNGLSDNRVKCIREDKQGDTWIGTENGLNRYHRTTGKFEIFNTGRGLSGNIIGFILEDSGGDLLIGTNAGLDRISDGIITAYRYTAGEDDYFLECAYEDKEGMPWLGTDRGLILAQRKADDSSAKAPRARLTENQVCTILEDDRGNFWLGGRKGISRAAKKDLVDFAMGKTREVTIQTYNEKDGMKSRWCKGPGCKSRDGLMWFPTSMGVVVIDPHTIKPEPIVSAPVIEKIIADGEAIPIKSFCGGPGGGVLEKSPLAAGGSLDLGPGKKRLGIYYTAVSFNHPQKVRFRIKLEGYDSDWEEVGNLRSAVYTGLAPGHYTFKVIAGNQEGTWNPKGAALSFYLRPYFYQAAWFYIIAAFFLLGAAFTFYRVRVGRLKAREKELNELVKSRTAQLEEQSGKLKEMDKIKSRFFANISHEFRTPLTLILGPLEQMLSGPQEKEQEQKKKMRLMLRNSRRLLGLINQLLELSKFDSGTMKLQTVRQDIVPFLKGVLHSFDSLAVQKEVELIFQTETEYISLYYDPEKMEEVISNLVSNAVKFTPAGGRITMSVEVREAQPAKEGKEEQEILEVSVSDTGPGIPREALEHIFDRFYQADSTYELHRQGTGIGLAIAREIVELHRGTITAYSPGREGTGTLFVIRLPMGAPAARGALEGPSDHLESRLIAAPNASVSLDPSHHSSFSIQHSPGKSPRLHGAEGIKSADDAEEIEPVEKEEETSQGLVSQEKDIILVIEDSADVREYIRGALEPQYMVKEAKDGDEGLEMAGEIVPDLIICDVMMPGKDGFEVCRGIKSDRVTSHIPVILLTAKAGEENIIQGLETGADDYITKPFSTRILTARIKNLIELRRQFQQNLGREMSLQPAKAAVNKIDQEFLRELREVIEENLSDPGFNVDQLSRKLYMSHATLYRKINALTGENPVEFIRTCRLKRGAELLKAGKGNVGDVAFEVGFYNTSYFIKCFKEKFHRLPSSFMGPE
jgi:signal transduction histidine kinase/ligand-binding sensor domain-containing protein/CheY-like chemotaxis protein/AraC-like DNA-binding protein